MEQAIIEYIEGELRDVGEEVELHPDDDLVLIGFDSVAYVRLVAFIKNRYGIRVPDADVTVGNFGTVAAIVGYLEAKGAES